MREDCESLFTVAELVSLDVHGQTSFHCALEEPVLKFQFVHEGNHKMPISGIGCVFHLRRKLPQRFAANACGSPTN